MLEICCFSLESCETARDAGANRIELCSGMAEGGTTPSAGLIRLAVENMFLNVQVYVMIRPRGGDFCYSENDIRVMRADIRTAKNLGASGVVLGMLNPDGSVDKERTTKLVKLAAPMGVTFHRAFDMTNDPIQAMEDIIECGCERILTSGQKNTAIEGIDLIKTLVEKSNNRIEIMAGSGVTAQNARQFLDIGVHALHMTGRSIQASKMIFRKPDVSMTTTPVDIASLSSEYEIYEADFKKCKAVAAMLKK